MEANPIIIIGAGISGLALAITLQQRGRSFMILEANDRVGGRICTDEIDGYKLDRGFQVYLDAYTEGKHFFEYADLNLKRFDPGALILLPNGQLSSFADPGRKWTAIFNLLSSKVGNLEDKLLIYSLKTRLLNQRSEQIFEKKDYDTARVLERYGYSTQAKNNFFIPFFRGIFLEKELQTNRKMFDFVFKMFAKGYANLPAQGMEELPKQLLRRIPGNLVHYNTKAVGMDGLTVITDSGQTFKGSKIIWACPPVHEYHVSKPNKFKPWNGVTTVYFSSDKAPFTNKMIALNASENAYCNHLAVVSNISPDYAPKGKHLISANIIGIDEKSDGEISDRIKEEMRKWFGPEVNQWSFLKCYRIPNALPNQESVCYNLHIEKARISDDVFVCGDWLLNGSIQAALRCGRQLGEFLLKN